MTSFIRKEEALMRIDNVIKYVEDELDKASKSNPMIHPTYRILNLRQIPQLCLRMKQTLLDMSPRGSEYWNYATSVSSPFKYDSVAHLLGALNSLREDYAKGFLIGFNEMIDADIFTDILEQAEYLLKQGYFRASAVVAGVALESHLRKLAEKNQIPITSDDGKYVKADSINGDLFKNQIIDKTMNKSITSWLGLRNDAAHPDAKQIDEGMIELMIAGIKVFIEKYPA